MERPDSSDHYPEKGKKLPIMSDDANDKEFYDNIPNDD